MQKEELFFHVSYAIKASRYLQYVVGNVVLKSSSELIYHGCYDSELSSGMDVQRDGFITQS